MREIECLWNVNLGAKEWEIEIDVFEKRRERQRERVKQQMREINMYERQSKRNINNIFSPLKISTSFSSPFEPRRLLRFSSIFEVIKIQSNFNIVIVMHFANTLLVFQPGIILKSNEIFDAKIWNNTIFLENKFPNEMQPQRNCVTTNITFLLGAVSLSIRITHYWLGSFQRLFT